MSLWDRDRRSTNKVERWPCGKSISVRGSSEALSIGGLYDRDVVFSYQSLDAHFRVYDRDHLQIVSRKKLADRFLIQVLRSCDHVGQHNVLDSFVAGSY